MNWQFKILILSILAIPAFTGYPVNLFKETLLPGVELGWIVYGFLVHAAIFGLLRKRSYRVALFIALLLSLPVVCLGAGISFISLLWRGWDGGYPEMIITRYVSLAITMLTVIPLALTMGAMIPIHRIENRLLQTGRGIGFIQKSALMAARVFTHIIYFVIPDILEVLREERILNEMIGRRQTEGGVRILFRIRIGALIRLLVNIGVESTCAAIRYIPLWAEEISKLPGRSATRQKPGAPDKSRP